MLSVEFVSMTWGCELAHLQSRNGETVFVDCINDLTSLGVTVWFDHSEGSLRSTLESLLGEEISIIDQLELTRVYGDNRAEEEFFLGNSWASHSLHKHSSVFEVILNIQIAGEKKMGK